MADIARVGLDVGFGVVKAAVIRDGRLDTGSFPSLVGQAQELAGYRSGLGGGRRSATRLWGNGERFSNLRLREGRSPEEDRLIGRLEQLPKGQRSRYLSSSARCCSPAGESTAGATNSSTASRSSTPGTGRG